MNKLVFLAAAFCACSAFGDLDTVTYVSWDGGGDGRVEGDMTGVGPVTLYDGEGGDMWDGGDQYIFLHDAAQNSGNDFTATVRVVGQTQSVEGRWGKAGILATAELDGLSQGAMAQVYSGTGSQIEPPASTLEHSPVPVRIGGRTGVDGTGGFEIGMSNSSGEIANNVFPETTANVLNPTTNASWLRLQYRAESNAFVAGFAPDVDGTPGEWGYSPIQAALPAAADGWYIGLAYSAHTEMVFAGLDDEEGMHGITFDNYSIVPEYITPQFQVGGTELGTLGLVGNLTNAGKGNPVEGPGLAQTWYQGSMRANPEAFLEAGDEGSEAFPLLYGGGAFSTDTTWWIGGQAQPLSDQTLPGYPAEVTGIEDNYSVRLKGEIFVAADGSYAVIDGVDDYTMVAMDLDGNGVLDGVADLLNIDVVAEGAGEVFDDIVIHDDDWSNIDGSDNPYTGFAEFENIAAGGEWRQIEMWTGEAGGGDGGILYMALDDDADRWDEAQVVALTPEQRDAYVVKQENLRSTVSPVISGDSAASLGTALDYVVAVGPDGSDQIVVEDLGGLLVTTLDVAGAMISIDAADGIASGTEFKVFDADSVTGIDSLTLNFADASLWDLSRLAEGIIVFGEVTTTTCNPNTMGDLDGSGDVAFADFLILSQNFGQVVADHTSGDIDCSGDVAFADFLILSQNFGQTVGGAESVPEPTGAFMLVIALSLVGTLRRRRV